MQDERKAVLAWQLCDDLTVRLFNYVYFLIKQIHIKGTDSIRLRGSVSSVPKGPAMGLYVTLVMSLSADGVHCLTCAMMLLNTDLHGHVSMHGFV